MKDEKQQAEHDIYNYCFKAEYWAQCNIERLEAHDREARLMAIKKTRYDAMYAQGITAGFTEIEIRRICRRGAANGFPYQEYYFVADHTQPDKYGTGDASEPLQRDKVYDWGALPECHMLVHFYHPPNIPMPKIEPAVLALITQKKLGDCDLNDTPSEGTP